MSGLFNIFDVSASALTAQSVRLNTVASNLANAQVASPTAEDTYRGKHPLFQAVLDGVAGDMSRASVRVADIWESNAPPIMEYAPNHPLANPEGYIFKPNINVVEEMANMMSASRSYQSNVDVLNTTKQLLLRTLQMGQQ